MTSRLIVNSIRHTGASADAITLDNSGNATFPANVTCSGTATGFGDPPKATNLIVNGAMNVAQRGTSSTSNLYQTVDRFRFAYSGVDENPTQAQVDVASGTTPYTLGFRKALKLTNGNQTSGAGTSDRIAFEYRIEAQDIAGSGWNYTSASSNITLSFWIKSSVAQNFHFYFETVDGTAQIYPMSTGTLSANTWAKITKTIPGNSNIQIDNNNEMGLKLYFSYFTGTDYTNNSQSLNAWGAYSSASRFPDDTSTWYTTNDSTLEMTGLQLEVGDSASDFAHESYGETLRKCHRYFYSAMNANGAGEYMGWGIYLGAGKMMSVWYMPQPMRTNATVSFPTGTNYYAIYRADGSDQFNSLGSILGASKFAGNYFVNIEILSGVSSTGGFSGTISAANSAVYVHFSAEL